MEITSSAELLSTQSRTEKFLKDNPVGQFLHAAAYGAVEAPADAVIQIGAKAVGVEPGKLGLISAPEQSEFGSGKWYAQTAGSAVGMVVPFLVARQGAKCLGNGLLLAGEKTALTRATTLTLANSQALKVMTPYMEAAATGAIAEGLLRPSDMTKDNFWQQRVNNATVGAATFTALVGGNRLLKGVDANIISKESPWLVNTFRHDALRHVISGGGAGLLSAELHAQLNEGRHATGKELFQSAYTFSVLGGGFRVAGEVVGQARGTQTASDAVAGNKGMQEAMRDSTQARNLLLDYGDVRVAKPGRASGVSESPLQASADLVGKMALAEAQTNIANGKSWEDVLRQKIKEDPSETGRVSDVYNQAVKNGLPDQNWAQSRFAMIRERAFLNDLLNKDASNSKLADMVDSWNTRWSNKVDPGQELLARLSKTFNANDKDAAGKEQYQAQMKVTADSKTKVVASNLEGDAAPHKIFVDIGAAEGNVPNNIARMTDGKVTSFAVDLDPGSYLTMLEARRASMASGDGSFRAIPVFADGVSLKLPTGSVDVFSTLSNVHELVSYPPQYYGTFNQANARLAVHNWALALRDGGKIVVKDFLRPAEGAGDVYLVPKEVGVAGNPAMTTIEGKPLAAEYQGGKPGERWVQEFTGNELWRGPDGPRTIKFKGQELKIEWVTLADGTRAIKCDSRTAAELMASARYGMLEQRTQMIGVTEEQFVNFTVPGWNKLFHDASPFGSRLSLVPESLRTKAGADYVDHRQTFFDLRDAQNRPIDLSGGNKNWHTTYEAGFAKAPGSGSTVLRYLGGPQPLPFRPLMAADRVLGATPNVAGGLVPLSNDDNR